MDACRLTFSAYMLAFDIDGISSFSSAFGPKFSVFVMAFTALSNITDLVPCF